MLLLLAALLTPGCARIGFGLAGRSPDGGPSDVKSDRPWRSVPGPEASVLDADQLVGPRDFGSRDLGPHDLGPHDLGPHDLGPHDFGPHDLGPRESSAPSSTSPSGLGLSHVANRSTFRVSWTAGSGNGGASGCKLQFERAAGAWVDITSAMKLDCDSNVVAATYTLNGDGWKSAWNATRVQLVRRTDGVVMGVFPQTLSCDPGTPGSPTSTPSIDEDCDGAWDNTRIVSVAHEVCAEQGLHCYAYLSQCVRTCWTGNWDGCGGGGPSQCASAPGPMCDATSFDPAEVPCTGYMASAAVNHGTHCHYMQGWVDRTGLPGNECTQYIPTTTYY